MKRVAFRVDASPEMGTGHLVRCLTLAKVLRKLGAHIRFLSSQMPADFASRLAGEGFDVALLAVAPAKHDAAQCANALKDFRPDWLVVDHYQLDVHWETALRHCCQQILVIDDKADRPHDCDLLLDQNINSGSTTNYRRQVSANTRLLLGPHYALLSPEFAVSRARRGAVTGQVKRVLICFGGSDPGNHTSTTITAIRPFVDQLDHIDIVIGTLNQHREVVMRLCSTLSRAHLHCPANNMAELLQQADLAIGAGGTMNWERACLGIPSLVFGIADNQVAIAKAMIEAGYVGGQASMQMADPQSIARWIGIALDNPALLRGLSTRSKALVDGKGAERVARHLMHQPLTFRRAEPADSDNLLCWRNTPEIRQVSMNTDEIDVLSHRAWLFNVLSDSSRRLLIAEADGTAVGVVRFDLDPPNATISIYRVPNGPTYSAGLIEQATAWLRRQHPEITRVIAEVKSNNSTSLLAFRAAGYGDNSTSLVFEWSSQ